MVYLDNNNEKQNVFIPRMTVNIQNYTPSTGGGEGYATEEWVESQGYITPSNLKTINGESLVGSGNIVIEGGVPSESDGVFILEYVGSLHRRRWTYSTIDWTETVEYDYYEEYVGSSRQEYNTKVLNAISDGTCRTVYYKRVKQEYSKVVEEDTVNSTQTLEIGEIYEYVPVSFADVYDGYKYYEFRGVYADGVNYINKSVRIRINEDNSSANEYFYDLQQPTTKVYSGIRSNNDYRISTGILGTYYDYLVDYNVVFQLEDRTTTPYTYKKLKINGKEFWDNELGMQIITLWGIDETGMLMVWQTPTDGTKYSYPTQINLAQADVDLSNYFTKEETEQLISSIDLSNYYTKTETDELINNINIGDGDTIASLVEQEVTEQLTDNFKTINGQSIIGEGNIEIEGGGSNSVFYQLGHYNDNGTGAFKLLTDTEFDEIRQHLMYGTAIPIISYGYYNYESATDLKTVSGIPVYDNNKLSIYGEDYKFIWDRANYNEVSGGIGCEMYPNDEGCVVFKPLDNYTITVYDLDTNEQLSKERYTYKSNTAAKAFNGDVMKKIKNGLVKSLVVPIPSKLNADEIDSVNNKRTTRPQFIYVPLAFGWEYTGNYGYATGVCKYWHEGILEYNYIAIDMNADGTIIKYEVQSMDGIKTIAFDLNNPNQYIAYEAWNLGNPLYGSYQFDDENATTARFPISVIASKGNGLTLWGKMDRTRNIEVVWSNMWDGTAPTITVYED